MQKTWFDKMLLRLKTTALCIEYPFLYPRNRFTGLHYNDYKVLGWCKTLTNKYKVFRKIAPIDGYPFYYESFKDYESYWTNFWALPLTKLLIWIHSNPIQWIHCLTDYTELDALPKPWKDDFGLDWARDLKKYLKEHNIKHYRIAQIKEKYGEFDWLYPPDYKDCRKLEHKYIERSKQICICCGDIATMTTPTYIWKGYYCSKCAPKYAYPISRQSIILKKKELDVLIAESQHITNGIELIQDNWDSDVILNYNDSELNLSN